MWLDHTNLICPEFLQGVSIFIHPCLSVLIRGRHVNIQPSIMMTLNTSTFAGPASLSSAATHVLERRKECLAAGDMITRRSGDGSIIGDVLGGSSGRLCGIGGLGSQQKGRSLQKGRGAVWASRRPRLKRCSRSSSNKSNLFPM